MGNPNHKSNEEIELELQQVKAAQANPKQFNVLYEKYYKPIYVFIYRRTFNEHLTADITSQVFLKALIHIKKYSHRGMPFSSWLFRIALNEVNMYFRKHKSDRIVALDKSGIQQLVQETQSNDNEEDLNKLTLCLKKLDEEDLQLIELRFFEKHSFAEVGSITGITENNAKVKVYRILDKLKKIMSNLVCWLIIITQQIATTILQ
jgi:RNA polymerase sigma-70 factor, ECF subfamily